MSYSTSRNSYRVGPYRSFIEFKWALAFDWLRIYYEYEPRCYKLPDGRKYLPDFYVVTAQNDNYKEYFCEVKQKATPDELKKCWELSIMLNIPVIVLEKYPSMTRCFKGFENGQPKFYYFNGVDFEETKSESPRKTNTNSNVGKIIHTIKEGEVIEHIRSTMNRPYNQTPAWHDWTDSHV